MSDEIAEFLRRAAQRRAQQTQQQANQQAQAPRMPPSPPAVKRASLSEAADVVVAEVLDDSAGRPPISKMGQQVNEHLNTRGFSKRAENLGEITEQADAKMESHLHTKFDHKIGNIARPAESATAEIKEELNTRTVANHPILDLLRNAQSIRSAFILSELMRRPEENW